MTFATFHVQEELMYWKPYKDFHKWDMIPRNNSELKGDDEVGVVAAAAADSAAVVVVFAGEE